METASLVSPITFPQQHGDKPQPDQWANSPVATSHLLKPRHPDTCLIKDFSVSLSQCVHFFSPFS